MTASIIETHAAVRTRSLEQRRDALRDRMRESGLELLIAYGSRNHSFFQWMSPGWYVTGFKQMGQHMAVLLPLEGDVTMVMSPAWDAERATERATTVDHIVPTTDEDFFDTVRRELRRQELNGLRTGVAGGGDGQGHLTSEAWSEVLGHAPEPVDKLVSDLAKIRDEWSLWCTREATRIAEEGYSRLLAIARPGMSEHVLAGELEVFMRELGADDNFQLMSASQHNRLVHAPTDRRLESGDVLLGEISPSVEGEFLQICRTAVIGEPTDLQRRNFGLLDTALRAGLAAAKPGTPIRKVVEAINEPIAAAGYERYTRPPFMRTRGHSMGLGSMDPELALDNDDLLQEGMVFVMHPNQYLPDTGYMMCGEPVLITERGAEPLTSRMGTLDSIV